MQEYRARIKTVGVYHALLLRAGARRPKSRGYVTASYRIVARQSRQSLRCCEMKLILTSNWATLTHECDARERPELAVRGHHPRSLSSYLPPCFCVRIHVSHVSCHPATGYQLFLIPRQQPQHATLHDLLHLPCTLLAHRISIPAPASLSSAKGVRPARA